MPFFNAKDDKEYETFVEYCDDEGLKSGRVISVLIHKFLVAKKVIKE